MSHHPNPTTPTMHRSTSATKSRRLSARQRTAQRRHHRWLGWGVTAAVVAVALVAVALGGRTSSSPVSGAAPPFQLESTAGTTVSLADYKGRNVLLFFNEGVGCDACFMQMAKLEADGGLAKAGVTIVPVVMNSASQVAAELQRYGIRTPYLVDPNGSVSSVYKTLGTGHHANLPGHTFILVGPDGTMTWRGDYPGMWVDPAELTAAVQAQLR